MKQVEIERRVERIIKRFNFKSVHAAMVAVGWEWSSSLGVPSIAEMKTTARKLLTIVAKDRTGFISTGGFRAEIDNDGTLSLVFELEEALD